MLRVFAHVLRQASKTEASPPTEMRTTRPKTTRWRADGLRGSNYCTLCYNDTNTPKHPDKKRIEENCTAASTGALERTGGGRALVLVEHRARALDVLLHEQQLLHTG